MKSEGFKETEIGLIPEDWDIKPFDKILIGKIRHGLYKNKDYFNDKGVKILKMGVQYSNDRIGPQTMDKVELSSEELKRFKINVNDLIFSRTSMMELGSGKCSIVIEHDSPIVFDGNLLCATINKGIGLPLYFYYFFNSELARKQISMITTGTQSRNISASNLNKLLIPIPLKKEQIIITKILFSFDEKIRLNLQMNRTLEKIGQAIFNHWFVNFEFTDENGKDYKSNGGEMTYSELGDIPSNWEVKLLPEVTKIVDCLHTKKPDYIESDNILLQVYNIAKNGTLYFDKIYTVSKPDYHKWTKNILLKEGDCIITNAGRVGAVGQVPPGFEGGIGRNITALRPEKVTPTYLFRYLFSKHGVNQILSLTDQGTILNSLNVKGIKKIRIIVPPKDVLKEFDRLVRPLREKVEKNNSENLNLTQIRDSILPKLISGKIKVKIIEGSNEFK